MNLPGRVYWALSEAATRWDCTSTDIVAWATVRYVRLSILISPVRCGERIVEGWVHISAAEVLPMFRRCGTCPKKAKVRLVRTADEQPWLTITDPVEGVAIKAADVMLLASEVERFEREHDIPRRTRNAGGRDSPYDWGGAIANLLVRTYLHGLPESQNAMVAEVADWFARRSDTGDHPDERTIRRRISPIWRRLQEADEGPAA